MRSCAKQERQTMEWPPKLPRSFPLTVHPRGYVKSGLGWICGKKTPAEALKIYHEKAQKKLENKPLVDIAIGDEQTVEQLAERYSGVRASDAANKQITIGHLRSIDRALSLLLE